MNTAIIYMSKHDTTQKIAEMLKDKLGNETTYLFNLKTTDLTDLGKFDAIIIGGSIHAGSIQSKLKKFMNNNLAVLNKKRIALFLVCMDKTEKRKTQFENGFLNVLREISIANGFMGGEFCFDKMNFIEKAIIKKISGKSTNVSEIDYEAIDEFVNKLSN